MDSEKILKSKTYRFKEQLAAKDAEIERLKAEFKDWLQRDAISGVKIEALQTQLDEARGMLEKIGSIEGNMLPHPAYLRELREFLAKTEGVDP